MDDIEASLLDLSLAGTAEERGVGSEAAVAHEGENVGGTSGTIENEAEAGNGHPLLVASINHMPDLVLLKIFSFFDVYKRKWIELVSKRWLQMSRLSLKYVRDVIIDLSRFGPPNRQFWKTSVDEDDVGFVGLVNGIYERCNLKTLTLMNSCEGPCPGFSRPNSMKACFTLVWTSFPNLESLLVLISRPRCWLQFRRSLPFISDRFQSLRHLKLNFLVSKLDPTLSAPALSLKLKSFPFLVTFDVCLYCWKESLLVRSSLWDIPEMKNTIDVSCDDAAPSLKKFHFTPAYSLPRGSIKALVDSCPELEDFELGVFDFGEMEDIVELRRLKLKLLSLDRGVGSLPTSFHLIFYSQSRLETFHLSLPHLQDEDKKEILRIVQCECENLRDVNVSKRKH